MRWVFLERSLLSPSEQPFVLSQPPPSPINLQSSDFNLNNKVSPSILLIIIILAIIFFVSGLLHLLVRFLLRPQSRDPDEFDNVTALQGQLQQLFHLHDAGVDQSFIDTLPVFNYKAIIGVKNPFDCAVCLCEFESEDKLRLLPKCSHAFHTDCIDTWLLSHSTCPLCRASLLPDFSANSSCSPIVFVLESGNESSRENFSRGETNWETENLDPRANSHLGNQIDEEIGFSRREISRKSCEIQLKDEENQKKEIADAEEKVVPVKLGKFKSVDGGGEGSSNNNVDERRCFSMGSFAYIMDENTSLQVPIRATPIKKQSSKKTSLPLTPGHRPAMSECGCDSRREFNGLEAFRSMHIQESNGNAIGRSKRESFSVSKIWLRGKKEKPFNLRAVELSRRAVSFRFPVHRNVMAAAAAEDAKGKSYVGSSRGAMSEIHMDRWENGGGSGLGFEEEIQNCHGLDSQSNLPSFARRTLLWLMGRQNKVVHSSFSTNV